MPILNAKFRFFPDTFLFIFLATLGTLPLIGKIQKDPCNSVKNWDREKLKSEHGLVTFG